LTKALTDHGIIPDILSNFTPTYDLLVKFPSGKKAQLGKELPPTAALSAPTVTWPAEPDAYYSVAMIDPDAPNRDKPSLGEWRHWLVGNIPGDNVIKGEDLTDYEEPKPPQGSGLHRYVILLFKQRKYEQLTVFEGKRSGWNVMQWAKKHGMKLEGVNFFQAQEK
ncbi:OV-16 antigen-like protein, partial [Gaertneriomyces semiglobifer]